MPRLRLFDFGHKDIDMQRMGFANIGRLIISKSDRNVDGPRADFRGLHIYSATGDSFAGSGPDYPSYYVTKTTVPNSTATDTSGDITNIYQGDTVWPFVDMQYQAGSGAVGKRGGLEHITFVRDGAVSIGDFINGRGGGGLLLGARLLGAGVYMYCETGDENRFIIRTLSAGAMPPDRVGHIGLAGGQLISFHPVTDNKVNLGEITPSNRRWKDLNMVGVFRHAGTQIGVMNATPISRPAAYIQNYSLTTRTHNTLTAASVVDNPSTQATPWGYSTQGQADAVVDMLNALIEDVRAHKQLTNQIIDDLQAYGWYQ